MAQKEENLVIEDWAKEIAPSPILGFGQMRNLDTTTNPGSIRLNQKAVQVSDAVTFTVTIASPAIFSKTGHGLVATNPVKFTTTGALPTGLTAGTTYYVIAAGLTADAFEVSATVGGSAVNTSGSQSGVHSYTTVTGLVIGYRRDPLQASNIWAYTDSAVVLKSTDNGVTWAILPGNSTGTGTGIEIWKDYLFVSTLTKLDVYGPLTAGSAWSLNWQTLTSDTFHTMLASVDDKLYICNNKYIANLSELTTFAPGTAASYTWNATAITLKAGLKSKCLADLGQFLTVGTWMGSNIFEFKVANIYPYARTTLTLGIPLILNENGVNAMLSNNNRLYVQAGMEGKIFETDSTSFQEISKIPHYVCNLDNTERMYCLPGAIMHHKGRIYFGLSSDNGIGNMGVWSVQPGEGINVLKLENIISTGNDGTTNPLAIGALLSTNLNSYLIGWRDNAAYGIDLISNTLKCVSGYFHTALYRVGEVLKNRTLPQMESYFEKPLVNGQGIKIEYRFDLTSAFTTLIDYTFTDLGTNEKISFNRPASVITNAVFTQFKVTLSTGSSNLSPELRTIMFKPSE